MKKRLLSLAMALCMVLSLLPATAFADENAETPVCTCEEACTAEDMDAECPVCGAEDATVEDCCKYAVPATEAQPEATTPPEAPVCACEEACTAEAMNTECPVCDAEGAAVEDCCKYVAPEQDGSTEATTPQETPVCACEEACTAEAMDAECPVCGAEGAVVENCGKYIAPVVEDQVEEVVQMGAPAGEEPELTAVEKVQAKIDALPTVEELEDADDEKVDEVYAALQDVCDAMDELGEEELDQITGLDKLAALMEWFTGSVSTYEGEDYSYLDYKEETDGTITITGLNDKSKTEINIPMEIDGKTVTSISFSAFDCCISLKSITIPETVQSIGHAAFSRCTDLSSVNIPNGVTTIQEATFYNCTSLTSIEIPDSVTTIETIAFYNCTSLVSIEIPNSVVSIGSSAFDCESDSNLAIIFLPDKDNFTIDEYAIPDTTTQVKYSLDTENDEVTITEITLGTDKSSVAIPATICGYPVVAISDEGLLTKISSHTCAGGQATCQTKAICGICKQEYGDYADHALTKTEAKGATCTEDGNTAYWTCSVCHKLFSDEDGTNETTLEAVTIKAAHKLTKTEAKGATCTEDGNTAYWTCSVCNKYFSDETGTNEIAENSWVIKAAHKLTKTEAKGAICTEDGNTAYWTCSVCNKLFSDENGTNETTLEAVTIKAAHTLSKTEAKGATCTEDGNTAYWTCSVCNKYFSDETGTNEIEKDSWVIKAAHKLTKTEARDATCTEDGNTEYWTCSVCNKYFSDENGTNEIEKDSWVIKAAHKLTKTEARDATVTETGNKEYWQCQDCGKYFADENGTNEIADLEAWKTGDGSIDKLPPEIIKGKGQSVTEGEKKALSFTSNAVFSDFICVELDGKALDEKNYTAKEGSTVVTLDAGYVSTLSSGEHTIGIVSESGTASTTFTVDAKADSTDSPQAETSNTNSPQTGDNSPLALWIALLFVSGGLLTVIGIYGKKKKYNR